MLATPLIFLSFKGMAQSLPDRGIVDELTKMYLDAFYCTSDRTDSAEVNDIQR